jgi:hypothetical protein
MITITLILLILAFICAVLAILEVSSRIDLTAIGLLLVVVVLLLGSVH